MANLAATAVTRHWALIAIVLVASLVIALDMLDRAIRFAASPPHLFNLSIFPFAALTLALGVGVVRAIRGRPGLLVLVSLVFVGWGVLGMRTASDLGQDPVRPAVLLTAGLSCAICGAYLYVLRNRSS